MSEKTEKLIERLNKEYGKGTAIGTQTEIDKSSSISTGSLTLDVATGCGGYPGGKIIEIMGPESSGKSTLTLHSIAETQKNGEVAALLDFEHSFDASYAKSLGVNLNDLIIIQPEYMEQGYDIVESLIGEARLIIIDSHTAMPPKKVVETSNEGNTIGLQARINSTALLKLKGKLAKGNSTLIGISQLRTNIGVMYGDPNISTGGNSWKFYSDMRFKVSRSVDKQGELALTKVEVIKNKCAAPFKKAQFNINFGEGIDRMGEVIELAVQEGIIEKGGAWFTVGEEKVQGVEKVKQFLLDNEEFYKEIEEKILNILTK